LRHIRRPADFRSHGGSDRRLQISGALSRQCSRIAACGANFACDHRNMSDGNRQSMSEEGHFGRFWPIAAPDALLAPARPH
jgi:hypothetical protein